MGLVFCRGCVVLCCGLVVWGFYLLMVVLCVGYVVLGLCCVGVLLCVGSLV